MEAAQTKRRFNIIFDLWHRISNFRPRISKHPVFIIKNYVNLLVK